MTIPALMNDIQDKELRAKFKKEYSTIANAITMMNTDYGSPRNAFENKGIDCTSGCITDADSSEKVRDVFADYIQNIKKIDFTGELYNAGCTGESMKDLNGQNANDANGWDGVSGIITNDGACVLIDRPAGGFMIDVNGPKPPNTFGRDLYYIAFDYDTWDYIKPAGYDSSEIYCGDGSDNDSGWDCATKVMQGIDY